MQLQSISDDWPNVISITRVREDIDSLTNLLEKYKQVLVLRGQTVLFKAERPETQEEKIRAKKRAAQSITQLAKSFVRKKGQKSLTDILISERDKMRSGSYEL